MTWMDVVRNDVEDFASSYDADTEWYREEWVTLLPSDNKWDVDVEELVDEIKRIVEKHEDELPEMHVRTFPHPCKEDEVVRLLPLETHEKHEEITGAIMGDINERLEEKFGDEE